jgi:uncharacterized membrane protein YccC
VPAAGPDRTRVNSRSWLRSRRDVEAPASWRLRRPTASSVEVAAKAAIAAALSIWVGQRIGLHDSYWAGISAVIATAGTVGGSLAAAVSRISATVVGLLVGLVAVALPVSGILVAGAAVFVTLLAHAALSLDAGARLGAATTLILTAIPGHGAVGDALARGANVPLGCAIAVGIGFALFPQRAGRRLRAGLRADFTSAGVLARSALLTYVGAGICDDLHLRLTGLVRTTSAHAGELRDAQHEPGEHGERLHRLKRLAGALDSLVDHVGSLVGLVLEGIDDRAPGLVRPELQTAGEAFAEAARAVAAPRSGGGSGESIEQMRSAVVAVDAAFAGARARRATTEFSTAELTRLMSVIRTLHGAASVLSEIPAADEPPETQRA